MGRQFGFLGRRMPLASLDTAGVYRMRDLAFR
jgi:integrase